MIDEAHRALAEIGSVMDATPPGQIGEMASVIQGARRIALHGVGREGLMMKSLAMRLFHLGLDAHVVGDMTTPPLSKGDLLIVSAGPGHFTTIAALVEVAKAARAATLCVTAEPSGSVPKASDHVIHLPAQTMAKDQNGGTSILPMGSLFEAAQFLYFELLVLHLRDAMALSPEAMRANHTNLE
ncbi:MAG: SIS domain-containing protein [Pseudomonadota bacterium]